MAQKPYVGALPSYPIGNLNTQQISGMEMTYAQAEYFFRRLESLT